MTDATPAAPADPRGRRFVWAMAALTTVQIAAFLAIAATTAIRAPYADIYSLISSAFDFSDGRVGLLAYLWRPHAGHHLPFARALMLWDMAAWRGAGWLPILVSLSAFVATAAILTRLVWRRAEPAIRTPAALLTVMLVLTGAAAFDTSQPVFGSYPLALVFAVGAIALFADGSPWSRGAAIVAAVAAALGNAVGLCVWPALLVLAWTGPRRTLWTAATLAAGVAFALIYLGDHAALAAGEPSVSAVQRLGFAFSYLGLPASQFSRPLGWLTAVALLAALGAGLASARREERSTIVPLAVALALFSLASAGLAAAGRVDAALGARAPLRYAPLLAPLHAAVLLLWTSRPSVSGAARARIVLTLTAMALLGLQAASAGYALKTAHTIHQALARHAAGDRSPAVQALVFPDPAVSDALDARLRREGLFQ